MDNFIRKKILVLGASGMLGNAVLRFFSGRSDYSAYGTVRSKSSIVGLLEKFHQNIIADVDVESLDSLIGVFNSLRPDFVVNCVGLVKQVSQASDVTAAVPINTILPHRLAKLCMVSGARLIHISTDCVFSGSRGMYSERDVPDADDVYGRSKCLGEVDYSNAITLRTSIIGHELRGNRSLISWFLSQEGCVNGFTKAIYSGLPVVELARVIDEFVIPFPNLRGLYHISTEPISKFELLSIVAKVYGKDIKIKPDESVVVDRSLNSDRFRLATGYGPKPWLDLVKEMHNFS